MGGLATPLGDIGWQARSIFLAGMTHSSRLYCCTTAVNQIHFSSWKDTEQSFVLLYNDSLPNHPNTHVCVQGYVATSYDRSQFVEVVGVVPLVLRDGKSSRGRRVKQESREGAEPFSELLVFNEEPKTQRNAHRTLLVRCIVMMSMIAENCL